MYEPDYSSILAYLIKSSRTWSHQNALIIRRRIKKEKILYQDIPGLLAGFDVWFTKNKIQKNTKILFWGMNCPEYALSLLSCMSLGRCAVPIDWRNSIETIEGIIEKTKPKHAFISKYFKHDFLKNRGIKTYFIEDFFRHVNKELPNKYSLLENEEYIDPERIIEIVFTSGTTGIPKGVVMKQKNILANLKSVEPKLPDLTGSRTISILPLSHMLEQVAGLLLPIGFGTTIYYLPRINSFRLLQAFSEYKPTHLVFVPQMLKIFWEKIEDKAKETGKYNSLVKSMKVAVILPGPLKKILFSSIHKLFGNKLKFVACGGAPLDRRVGENWFRVGIPIIEGYGATEATAIATINDVRSPKLGTVGKSIPGVEIKIDENGEIYIQSDSLSAGYYNDKERTKTAFTKNGYQTGDIGEFDREGNLHIKGRDVFKIVLPGGEKVFVEDLETKIIQDIRIQETCVVAKRISGGDKIHAYFILKKEINHHLKEIVTEINTRLESKQQIFSFALWPNADFPRTPTLKIDRKLVFEVANQQKDITSITDKTVDNAYSIQNAVDVLSKVSGIDKDRISDTDTLAGDLNIDSYRFAFESGSNRTCRRTFGNYPG
ncbi:MAG: AMP-binding protein [Candidatus Nomurabacteria bacterium GW2011_GWB1_37_5]|uniref:AMP-binding protein n=1 Tax=Candidatus Nomurabacteria bacterium GW2011_GWB1_37_5 TaxID=1618742 RepID=A0A0G0GUU1_9BACT|nr:MAG: AMP-binding protein [Candidatus Nomurabacteria bacterium GW2011_GWB1_37_5]